ncbi:unnamed protein product [Rhizoctonia solani]|uniref:HAT C-terminal dimerisation domain-containing protein n=1 Tax=Rhizoctonia solani TaxID=456999 RepID=A0A8H3DCI0_9AGAM|nr:unnamed protein product [Rhizoctonia solani]
MIPIDRPLCSTDDSGKHSTGTILARGPEFNADAPSGQNPPAGWGSNHPGPVYATHPTQGMMWPPPGSHSMHGYIPGHGPGGVPLPFPFPPHSLYHTHGSIQIPYPATQSNSGAEEPQTSAASSGTSKPSTKRRRNGAGTKSNAAAKQSRTEMVGAGVGPLTRQTPSSISNAPHAADLAAQSIPPGFVDIRSESVKPEKDFVATGAADCWGLMIGTSFTKEEATLEIKQAALKRAEAHLKADPSTLRRPSKAEHSHTLCVQCLVDKFEWHVWVNTDGGYTRGPRQHFEKEYPHKYRASCARIGYQLRTRPDNDGEFDEIINEPITTEGLAHYLAKLIAEQDLAFNIVQAPALCRLLCYAGQGSITAATIPERRFVRKVACDLTEKEKERIKVDMRGSLGRVSITSDLWSDHMERSFMAVTGHYKKQIRGADILVVELLAFRQVEGSHSGVNLARVLFGILSEYNILDKIGTITLDNASNNDTMMEDLERRMCEAGHTFDKDGNRVRCFPHIINLAVNAICDALGATGDDYLQRQTSSGHTPSDSTVEYLQALRARPDLRVREIVKALRPGQRRRALNQIIKEGNDRGIWKIEDVQVIQVTNADGTVEEREEEVEVVIKLKVLNLILDVKTRWSSTRDMLFRFSELYPAICDYIRQNKEVLGDYAFSHLEFEVLQRILAVFNIAHRAQALLSSEETPTLSLALPVYEQLISEWDDAREQFPELAFAITAGMVKIREYANRARSSPIYILAMFLNPCIKYTFFNSWEDEEKDYAHRVVNHWMLKYAEDRDREAEAMNAAQSSASQLSTRASNALGRGISNIVSRRDGPSRRSGARGVTPPRNPSYNSSVAAGAPDITPVRRRLRFINQPNTMSPSRIAATRRENAVKVEHDLYVAAPLWSIEDLGKDLVQFWNAQNCSPILQAISHDVLPVQASSVSSERVFSSSKNTCTLSRNKLGANTVEMLQILKYSLRNHRRFAGTRAGRDSADHRKGSESDLDGSNSASNTIEMWTRLDDPEWEHDAILDFDSEPSV